MKTIYIASGYNSWTQKTIHKAFATRQEADKFLEGLTSPMLQALKYKNTADLVTNLLRG